METLEPGGHDMTVSLLRHLIAQSVLSLLFPLSPSSLCSAIFIPSGREILNEETLSNDWSSGGGRTS